MWINTIKKWGTFYFFLLLIFNGGFLLATETVPKTDSTQLHVRQPDPATEKKIMEDDQYRYDRVVAVPQTPWERFQEWFWRKMDSIFSTKEGSWGVALFEYALIALVLVVVILLALKNDVRSLFSRKNVQLKQTYTELEEDLDALHFDELIRASVEKKDYRKAIRLHFLKLLKDLRDKGLIDWKINKTNKDYRLELSDKSTSDDFAELVLLFEYSWYGDFHPDENVYLQSVQKFNSFRN